VLIHLLNPKLTVLSGRRSSAGKVWKPLIQVALNEQCSEWLFKNTRFAISIINMGTEQIGAGELVMENFWDSTTNRY
jgi:hypothetical protein